MPAMFGATKPRRIGTIQTANSVGCLIVVAIIWSAFTLGFDGVILWGAIRQIRAIGFPQTSGVVTKSVVESHRGSKGSVTYSPAIEYDYTVAGTKYHGRQYRFGQISSNGGNARHIVDAYPVGRTIDVFYSPADPSIAVLKTGIEGSDLFMGMFLMPFNLAMIGIWYAAAQGMGRGRPSVAGGYKVIDDGYTTRVRLSYVTPLMCGLIAIGFSSFIGLFAIVFSLGFNPPVESMACAWGIILAIGVLAAVIWKLKLVRGDRDLVIDEMSQTVHLPQMFGRPEPLSILGKQIRAIEVEQNATRDEGRTNYTYSPMLVYEESGEQRRRKLCNISTQSYAESLAAWLRERLRLKPSEGPRSPDAADIEQS